MCSMPVHIRAGRGCTLHTDPGRRARLAL